MQIKYEDVLNYLKGGRGFIAKLARETGINRYRLYKWKEGNGEPSGDEMILLYEMVREQLIGPREEASKVTKAENTPSQADTQQTAALSKALEVMGRTMESLSRTNEDLVKGVLVSLNRMEANSMSAVSGTEHTARNPQEDSLRRTHTTPGVLTQSESEKLGEHLDEQAEKNLKSQKGRG